MRSDETTGYLLDANFANIDLVNGLCAVAAALSNPDQQENAMKVEFDAVVKEYAMRMIASLFAGPNRMFEQPDGRGSETLKERVFITVLQSMVRSGAANHKYDAKQNVDVFQATEHLIRNWDCAFPGATLDVDCSDRFIMKIAGNRSRYFSANWLTRDDDDDLGSLWPS